MHELKTQTFYRQSFSVKCEVIQKRSRLSFHSCLCVLFMDFDTLDYLLKVLKTCSNKEVR